MLQEKAGLTGGRICQVCQAESGRSIPYLNGMDTPIFNDRSIFVCDHCGFGETIPKIDAVDLDDYYKSFYRSERSEMHIDFENMEMDQQTVDRRSIAQLLLGRQFIKKMIVGSFMDIGAGSGVSFLAAKKLFSDIKLFALEANSAAKTFYQKAFPGISVVNDIELFDQKIDMILMSHSLEHFDIDAMPGLLSGLARILDDDGVLVIEVPYADLRGKDESINRKSDTPHLSFFSYEGFKMLAEQHGFEVCFMNTVGQKIVHARSTKPGMANGPSSRLRRNLKMCFRSLLKMLRLWDAVQAIRVAWQQRDFYLDYNFQYGCGGDSLRCVLKKKTV